MKTAISIPDHIFKSAEELANKLGMSRSQLYATAVARYIEAFHDKAVTGALNEIYGEEPATIDPVLVALQRSSLPVDEW